MFNIFYKTNNIKNALKHLLFLANADPEKKRFLKKNQRLMIIRFFYNVHHGASRCITVPSRCITVPSRCITVHHGAITVHHSASQCITGQGQGQREREKTYLKHCFCMKQHFPGHKIMKIRPVGPEFNFLSDFHGFIEF